MPLSKLEVISIESSELLSREFMERENLIHVDCRIYIIYDKFISTELRHGQRFFFSLNHNSICVVWHFNRISDKWMRKMGEKKRVFYRISIFITEKKKQQQNALTKNKNTYDEVDRGKNGFSILILSLLSMVVTPV